ncbi:sigma factor-like helix-turn-helix DNA-binding protein [Actinacidiphila glaucinigra]|uniref:sigma factor-like helix-turn-helix DNA-binding protein n=1 Tax=Actinacidiphila glaucinigra TaxID=235986 RepID=UPI0037C625A5
MPQSLTNAQPTAGIRYTGAGPGGGRHRGRRADGEPYGRGSGPGPGSGRHRRTLRTSQARPAVDGPVLPVGDDDSLGYAARFERDVLTHLDPVYRAASGVTGDPAEAEELVLEVFTRAHAAFPRLLDGVDHRAWLYDLLAAAFIGPHPEVCVLPPESGVPYGVRALALDDFVLLPEADVRAALLALPKEQRFAVYLASVEGFEYQDIADIMDVAPSIAAYWLYDARLRLWAAEGPRTGVHEEEYLSGGPVGAGQAGRG